MTETPTVHPSVKVDGARLKRDRKSAGYTQASFAAECGSVSLASVRRAEQGHRVIKTSLRRMADVLGQDTGHYAITSISRGRSDYTAQLEGKWTRFYLQTARGIAPFVVSGEVEIRQQGRRIQGELASISPRQHRFEKFVDCTVINNMLTGFTVAEGHIGPAGLSTISLVLSRQNNWLDGYIAWFNPDTDQIENSRHIMVRKNTPDDRQNVKDTGLYMRRELKINRLRSLLDSGYPVADAVTMLLAVEEQNM